MKNILKLGIASVFLSATAFFLFANSVNAGFVSSENVSDAAASGPRELYLQNCARCHGADGRSDTEKGRELDADDLTALGTRHKSNAKLAAIITKGKSDMPGFGKRLSAAQIRSVVAYIRKL